MAATVKWKVPFASLNGTKYRIDIYDPDFRGMATTLTGAADVFTTDEDSSDDFYAPVRTQTGTLRVVDPDGKLLEQLIPNNNTHRLVRLVNATSGAVCWQGFLSSEVYSQTYTSRTDVISISVNSVLAAMESVQLEESVAPTFIGVGTAVANVLKKIEEKSGVELFNYVYFPKDGVSILSKYFNMSTFFDKQEQCNEDSVKYIVNGISLKEMLERLCQFMGWTLRECGKSIYFCCPDDRLGMLSVLYADFKDGAPVSVFTPVAYAGKTFGNFKWTGDQHTKSISQGAKSVEVIANLSDFSMDMDLPECPVGHLDEYFKEIWGKEGETFASGSDWYVLANTNPTAYSNLVFNFQQAQIGINNGYISGLTSTTLENVLDHMAISEDPSLSGYTSYDAGPVLIHSGAFLSKEEIIKAEKVKRSAHDTADCIHCVMFPGLLTKSGTSSIQPIFTLSSVISTFMNEGYLRISSGILGFAMLQSGTVCADTELASGMSAKIGLIVKFGNKYWNPTGGEDSAGAWQTTKIWFEAEIDGSTIKGNWHKRMSITETEGYLIPIPGAMSGVIELSVMPMINYFGVSTSSIKPTPCEIIFSSLSIDNVQNKNNRRIERAENHYFRITGEDFSDEKQIDFQLGSDLDNLPSPSTPYEDEETPITKITFLDRAGVEETKRPEIDLLDRACVYYKKARRRLELQIEHPSGADIALQRYTESGKTYVPLSESRDWAGDSSTVTCFEMPNEGEYE